MKSEKKLPHFYETNDYTALHIEQKIAFHAAFSGENMLVTGGGGVGKSHWINILRRHLPDLVVCASTGSAATRISGITLDRLMGFGYQTLNKDEAKFASQNIINSLKDVKSLLIDEASMLRIDKFENLDIRLRSIKNKNKPFGGVQIIIVADFCQLKPVISKKTHERNAFNKLYRGKIYAFESDIYKEANFTPYVLTTYTRQEGLEQQRVLRNIRMGHNLDEAVRTVNELAKGKMSSLCTVLCATNQRADEINSERYQEIKGREVSFYSESYGESPTPIVPEVLSLKVGVRVILCANNNEEGYDNGDQGLVSGFTSKGVNILLDRGPTVHATKKEWKEHDQNRLDINGDKEVTGSFTQIPLRLAYAITIHKSQGMSLNHVAFDLSEKLFSEFMAYVALSRVISFDHLYLTRPLKVSDIKVCQKAISFTKLVSIIAIERKKADIARFNIKTES